VAEELYQAGFISYPRTETDKFSENHDLQSPVNEQTGHPLWGQYAQRLLDPQQNLWRNPGNGGHDDKAHPPIHPTRFSEGEANWTNDHKVCASHHIILAAFQNLTLYTPTPNPLPYLNLFQWTEDPL
jgi:DNA topoisomerase IA